MGRGRLLVAQDVRGLAEISDTVATVGRATTTVGETIRALPLVGGSFEAPAEEIAAAGREAVTSADAARESANSVATLLGLSIALVPTLPVFLLYIPGRVARARGRRALAIAIETGCEPWIDELLARRALVHLPVRRLRAISDDPLTDVHEGRHGALAAAELAWFGVNAGKPVRR